MTVKNSLYLIVLAMVLTSGLLYFICSLMRPVEIIAIHQRNSFSDVLVRHFPLTQKGQIEWWLKNKDMLKQRYNIPRPASYGAFTIIFWDFSGGYMQEGKYDRLCFSDMKAPFNCIEKNREFSVETGRDGQILFGVDDGVIHLKPNGEMFKRKYQPNL